MNDTLARLDALVGRWSLQPHVEGVGTAWTEFSWDASGLFLRQLTDADPMPDTTPSGWRENAPFPTTTLIGLDDATDEFTVLYADGRGVHRVYGMNFTDGRWTMWRDAPGFNQRFTGTLSADGDTVDARWETSADGATWTLDFELTYTRLR
ncbi:hypothetical protein [Herbidospora mongoliensis]|uniref:hypothetical protein n=1 Tax=Herbidospora mongoliensis TaxID=688067 RepID=UPI0008341FAE|nr:hypothetical protein [Herbidospora mongoliensis]